MTRHLRTPFALGRNGAPLTVAQDSEPDVRQCVVALVSTRLGSRPESPLYGIADPTFTLEPDVEQIRSALQQWEPRADVDVVLAELDPRFPEVRQVTVSDE